MVISDSQSLGQKEGLCTSRPQTMDPSDVFPISLSRTYISGIVQLVLSISAVRPYNVSAFAALGRADL
jgi:hypothetical protein